MYIGSGAIETEINQAQDSSATLEVVYLAIAIVQGREQFHLVLVLYAEVVFQSTVQLLHPRDLTSLLRQLIP